MGLSAHTLEHLRALGIAGVETAGVGGTSWSRIESLRHGERTPQSIAGEGLAGFLKKPYDLKALRKVLGRVLSGGAPWPKEE